jgi:hypothetical protein
LQAAPPLHGCRVESVSVVDDLEHELIPVRRQPDLGLGRVRVVRDVLQRFEAAGVHGRLGLLVVPPDAVRLDRDGDIGFPRLPSQGLCEALVGEEWTT